MRRLPQSTAYTVMLKLFLASDHVSAATGKTVAIKISKAGGAFADPNAGASNATEVSNGWYKFVLDTTDTATLGDLVVRGTSASCDDAEQVCQVVSATTGGATNLDAAVSAVKTKTDSLTFTVAGMVDSNVVDWKGATAPAMSGDAFARLGAPAGASHAADVAAVKVDTAAVKVQTDKITFTVANQVDVNVLDWKSSAAPAMTGDAYARIGAAGAGLTALGDTRIAHLDADISSRSSHTAADIWAVTTRLLTAGTNIVLAKGTGVTGLTDLDAAGVRGAVGLASANLDTQIGTLATATALATVASYVDTEVAAIKAKTDNLPGDPAAASDVAAAFASLQSHGDGAWSTATGYATINPDNASIAAIAERTGNLPDDPADQSLIVAATNALHNDIAALNNLSASQVKTQADAALADYDGPTNAELATALAGADDATLAAIAAIPAAPTAAAIADAVETRTLDANIVKVNGSEVTGTGASGDEWGPA